MKKSAGKSKKTKDDFIESTNSINTDPNGTWTGVPTDDPMSTPIQDADDL